MAEQLPKNKNLNITLSGDKLFDFYVHEVRLDEGLSLLPEATALVYAKKGVTISELSGLKDREATVELTQYRKDKDFGGMSPYTRWFAGIVTAVQHLGALQETKSGDITYAYKLFIRPNAVNMCYSHNQLAYTDVTPLEALKKLLDHHKVPFMFGGDAAAGGGNCPKLKIKSDFFQGDESDYDFMLRIMQPYSLYFFFRTEKDKSDAGDKKMMMLYISHGASGCLPTSIFKTPTELKEAKEQTEPVKFAYRGKDDSIPSISQWRMTDSVGVGYVVASGMGPGSRQASGKAGDDKSKRQVHLNSPLHNLSSGIGYDLLADGYFNALRLASTCWDGACSSMEAMPGTTMHLGGFYGANITTSISALVAGSQLVFRAPTPTGFPNTGDSEKVLLEIALECIEQGKIGAYASRGAAAIGEDDEGKVTIRNVPRVSTRYMDSDDGSGGTSPTGANICQATVCDSSGKTSGADGKGNASSSLLSGGGNKKVYAFYALVDGSKDKVKVWLLMPAGGYGQGLFRIPRLGDRVLLVSAGSYNYYMVGYLPCDDMPFVTNPGKESGRADVNQQLSLRYQKPDAVPGFLGASADIYPRVAYVTSGSNSGSFSPVKYSEIGFYNQTISDPGYYCLAGSTVANSKHTPTENTTVVLQSVGALYGISNEQMDYHAKNITFHCTGHQCQSSNNWDSSNGNVTFNDISTLTLTAQERILLQVGRNKIVIDRNGINLMSNKWDDYGTGPLDSLISIDSIAGVNVFGPTLMLRGYMGTTMTEGMGAAVKAIGGQVAISGQYAHITATGGTSPWANLTNVIGDFIVELAGIIKHFTSSPTDYVNNQKSLGITAASWNIGKLLVAFICKKKDSTNNSGSSDKLAIAITVLSMISTLYTSIYLIVKSSEPSWVNKPADKNGKITNGDCFMIIALAMTISVYVIEIIDSFLKGTTKFHSSKLKITPESLSGDFKEAHLSAKEEDDTNSVISGDEMNNPKVNKDKAKNNEIEDLLDKDKSDNPNDDVEDLIKNKDENLINNNGGNPMNNIIEK
ncbi:MAG: hypothetical protein MJ025_02140 [Victivallaceae bacterium]|nr:hypothetical protein [Victivallaceae bacterium]